MNPYQKLASKAFWKQAVSSKNMFDISGLWNPRFNLTKDHKVVTFGSCFAQHIGKALKARGFNWLITEPSPPELGDKIGSTYNYNIFSARTGNIYTTSLLMQWVNWALNNSEVPSETWEKDVRVYDPFRPRVEPNGFASVPEMRQSRDHTIRSFRDCITTADYFIFTLGLTESWANKLGYEYPMCPGTVAGVFNQEHHVFNNQRFNEVSQNLHNAITMIRTVNPDMKFILTVSPVPLTATMSGNHILVATMESKSILRAVAAQFMSDCSYVDYFPSYEIINSPTFKGTFFEQNQRDVSSHGVNFVMNSFFRCIAHKYKSDNEQLDIVTTKPDTPCRIDAQEEPNDEHCDEALLAAFGPRGSK